MKGVGRVTSACSEVGQCSSGEGGLGVTVHDYSHLTRVCVDTRVWALGADGAPPQAAPSLPACAPHNGMPLAHALVDTLPRGKAAQVSPVPPRYPILVADQCRVPGIGYRVPDPGLTNGRRHTGTQYQVRGPGTRNDAAREDRRAWRRQMRDAGRNGTHVRARS